MTVIKHSSTQAPQFIQDQTVSWTSGATTKELKMSEVVHLTKARLSRTTGDGEGVLEVRPKGVKPPSLAHES